MNIDISNRFIKELYIISVIFYVYLKITNSKNYTIKEKLYYVLSILMISIIYDLIVESYNSMLANISFLILTSLSLTYSEKNNLGYTFIIVLLASGFSVGILIISTLITSFIFTFLIGSRELENIKIFIIIATIELIFIFSFFKINRFKNGFFFAKNKDFINNIGIMGLILSGIIIMIYSMININTTRDIARYICIGEVLFLLGLILWIRRQITLSYKEKLKINTIHQLEAELEEEKAKNDKANSEIERLAKINHKYSSRIAATEDYVQYLASNINMETADEIGNLKQMVDNLSKDFKNELENDINITKTNILGIDSMLNYFYRQANKQHIEFNIKINCDIQEFIPKIFDESKIETLLGDHIKDAIIAINSGDNPFREILVEFSKKEKDFYIAIYDTGIPFEINTLLKLGKEQITTHKETGGSGIGFVTTFETLRNYNASLIIKEFAKNERHFTKAVIASFDGKNEYKIITYRAEEINKNSFENIIVENLLD